MRISRRRRRTKKTIEKREIVAISRKNPGGNASPALVERFSRRRRGTATGDHSE